MKVFLGSDHAGLPLKKKLIARLTELGYEAVDVGTKTSDSCDYTDYAHALAEKYWPKKTAGEY